MNQKIIFDKIIDKNLASLENDRIYDNRIVAHVDQQAIKKNFHVKCKELLKKYPRLYLFIVKIISPVYQSEKIKNAILRKYLNQDSIILNIASGNVVTDNKIINVDYFNYPEVDVVSDATNLCFQDHTADFVINEVSLHHIYNFKKVISESYRVLKPKGEAYFVTPFMAGFHESPNDFHRFTHEGLKAIFEEQGFKVKEIGIMGGAASGFTWVLTEFLAILFSFGSEFLYNMWFFIFTIALFPIKFLDVLLNKISFSKKIACTFYTVAEK